MEHLLIHNMNSQIIGWVDFKVPYRFTFVYPDNTEVTFEHIMRLTCMKTGCYILTGQSGNPTKPITFVIPQGHRYVREEPM